MDEFNITVKKEASLHYLDSLAKESERMLKATLEGDAGTVEDIMEFVHNTEVPILNYNNENELAAIVNLAYLRARDYYEVEREAKAGKGYADVLFMPKEDLEELTSGGVIYKKISQELTYGELYDSIDNVWSILYTTGYLTLAGEPREKIFPLRIPNREVMEIYEEQLTQLFMDHAKMESLHAAN